MEQVDWKHENIQHRDIVSFDEFEDSKENIKPLKQGRNPFTLRDIFHTDNSYLGTFKTRTFDLEKKRTEHN